MSKLFTAIKNNFEIEKLFQWESPQRIWKSKSREWYILWSIIFLIILSLGARVEAYVFMVSIIAFAFLWFIIGSIQPPESTHTITSIGIRTFSVLIQWKHVDHFWISSLKNQDFHLLHLDINKPIEKTGGSRVSILIHKDHVEKITKLLLQFADYGTKAEISHGIVSRLVHGKYISLDDIIFDKNIPNPKKSQKSSIKSLPSNL